MSIAMAPRRKMRLTKLSPGDQLWPSVFGILLEQISDGCMSGDPPQDRVYPFTRSDWWSILVHRSTRFSLGLNLNEAEEWWQKLYNRHFFNTNDVTGLCASPQTWMPVSGPGCLETAAMVAKVVPEQTDDTKYKVKHGLVMIRLCIREKSRSAHSLPWGRHARVAACETATNIESLDIRRNRALVECSDNNGDHDDDVVVMSVLIIMAKKMKMGWKRMNWYGKWVLVISGIACIKANICLWICWSNKSNRALSCYNGLAHRNTNLYKTICMSVSIWVLVCDHLSLPGSWTTEFI